VLTEDFNYNLPQNRIALKPVYPKDHSKLLFLDRKKRKFSDHHFYDLKDLLKEGDLLVFNNSKVIPARIYGVSSTGAKKEVLLLKSIDDFSWEALVKKGKEEELDFRLFKGEVTKKDDIFLVKFNLKKASLLGALEKIGEMPLPPYIKREESLESDKSDYQTVYARKEGSVAAPTAGLHFTDRLFRELDEKGIEFAFVTLHVGLGTFRPVKTDVVEEHKMHKESFEINEETALKIEKAKKEGRRVIAVGTTAVRVLESAAKMAESAVNRHHEFISGSNDILNQVCLGETKSRQVQKDVLKLKSSSGQTDIFIYPGYKFKIIDGLITNFHLPKSSLIMLVSAFAGRKFVMEAYQHAIGNDYRFYSYGDGMLIL